MMLELPYLPHRGSSHGGHHLRHHPVGNWGHVGGSLSHGVHPHGGVMGHSWVSHLENTNKTGKISTQTHSTKAIRKSSFPGFVVLFRIFLIIQTLEEFSVPERYNGFESVKIKPGQNSPLENTFNRRKKNQIIDHKIPEWFG